jgi:hypothetical protein
LKSENKKEIFQKGQRIMSTKIITANYHSTDLQNKPKCKKLYWNVPSFIVLMKIPCATKPLYF